jgi:hypothetical protein
MSSSTPTQHDASPVVGGTHDGTGAGDHDQPYTFGRRPTVLAPAPFSTRQYARLLLLRSRWQAGQFAIDSPRLDDQAGAKGVGVLA